MRFAFPLLMMLMLSITCYAQGIKEHGKHHQWQVMSFNQHGKMHCYMFTKASKKTGNYRKREEPYLMVTHISDREDQVSITPGYHFKKGTKPYIQIDNKKYRFLVVDEDRAWSLDSKLDSKLIANMKKGQKFRAQSTSILGTYSIDYYSLIGFTDAYSEIKLLCKGISIGE